MLSLTTSEEQNNTCFKFIGANSNKTESVHILTGTKGPTLLLAPSSEGGCDTCSFYSGEPSIATLMAYGESYNNSEATGSIAYNGEFGGSSAYAGGGEACGSIASTSSGCSSSGGGCSYSC